MPTTAHGVFPGGGAELVHYFMEEGTRHMKHTLLGMPLKSMRSTEVIKQGLWARLQHTAQFLDVWPQVRARAQCSRCLLAFSLTMRTWRHPICCRVNRCQRRPWHSARCLSMHRTPRTSWQSWLTSCGTWRATVAWTFLGTLGAAW